MNDRDDLIKANERLAEGLFYGAGIAFAAVWIHFLPDTWWFLALLGIGYAVLAVVRHTRATS